MMKLNTHQKKVIYVTVGILILLILYALKNTNYFVRAATFIFTVVMFYIVDVFFNLDFKLNHYIILVLIAAAGILLSPLYFISTNYDKILHLVVPFLIGFIVYFLADKTNLKFSTKLVITFSVIISFLAIFEIIEYVVDQLFDMKLQGVFLRDISGLAKLNIIMDRNDDTMIDLILGSIGTLLFLIYKNIGFYYKKFTTKKTKKK